VVTDDVDRTLGAMRPMLAFYIGGMGAKDMNFHKQVFARMGYEKEADEIQDLFFEGKRDEAIACVPDQMVADISLVGSVAKIRDDLAAWQDAGVTMLVIGAGSVADLRQVAEVVLG
jgi:alkanesulfonate monooxygenase SsuD/methylene tetrahydromethanopterin reductase-like flavin-dependent oxidoreductase (luciferase family)